MKTVAQDSLPPHNLEAERAAAGCVIREPSLAGEAKPEWFYDVRFRAVIETARRLAEARKPIGLDTVAAELAGVVENPAGLVLECDEACHSAANWPYWRVALIEAFTRRRILAVCGAASQDVRAGVDVGELLQRFEAEALGIRQACDPGASDEVDVRSGLTELVREYDAATHGGAAGLRTGYPDLDRLLGGVKAGQLIIIAARPAVGKTTLALNIAEHLALDKREPVAFFSLEMTGPELLHRLTCSRARVAGEKLVHGLADDAERQRVIEAHAGIARAPLHVCDRGGLTLAQLRGLAMRLLQRHGIKILFVDYLGLLRTGERGRSRYEETSLLSAGLKALAKELSVPVVALCQLNRDTEREGREPRLSDLRDSGTIEQDADAVLLLAPSSEGAAEAEKVRAIVAKHRAGRVGSVPLVFLKSITRFESAASDDD